MGYERIDAEREQAEESAYDYFRERYRNSDEYAIDIDEAIEEFKTDRLRYFYTEHPLIAHPSLNLLMESRELFTLKRYTAAQVFSGAATEVTFGDVLLKPIVHGFVHSPAIATTLIQVIDDVRAMRKFEKLLVSAVLEVSGINLYEHKIKGSSQKLWDGVKDVQTHRNMVLHKAIEVKEEAAALSIMVASTLLEEIFPSVIKSLGLHLHEELQICGKNRCGTTD
jgi:hypothetical protein